MSLVANLPPRSHWGKGSRGHNSTPPTSRSCLEARVAASASALMGVARSSRDPPVRGYPSSRKGTL
eukprot:1346219-Alexandrium_andersonii.AAC.1